MKKLLLPLIILLFIPFVSYAGTKDTVKFVFKVPEVSILENIVQSMKEGDFTPMASKLQSHVILIVKTDTAFVKYIMTKYEIIDVLNSSIRGINGLAKVTKQNSDYFILIESPEFKNPLMIGFGVGDDGMIFKVLIQ